LNEFVDRVNGASFQPGFLAPYSEITTTEERPNVAHFEHQSDRMNDPAMRHCHRSDKVRISCSLPSSRVSDRGDAVIEKGIRQLRGVSFRSITEDGAEFQFFVGLRE